MYDFFADSPDSVEEKSCHRPYFLCQFLFMLEIETD